MQAHRSNSTMNQTRLWSPYFTCSYLCKWFFRLCNKSYSWIYDTIKCGPTFIHMYIPHYRLHTVTVIWQVSWRMEFVRSLLWDFSHQLYNRTIFVISTWHHKWIMHSLIKYCNIHHLHQVQSDPSASCQQSQKLHLFA